MKPGDLNTILFDINPLSPRGAKRRNFKKEEGTYAQE
jgi:hypothetical protein